MLKLTKFRRRNRFCVVNKVRTSLRQARILCDSPQKKSCVEKITIRKPRKPNSARRKCFRAVFRLRKVVQSYAPGGDHLLKKFSNVLVHGRGARDLPGIYTSGIRGAYDFYLVTAKTKRRSLYGVKKSN